MAIVGTSSQVAFIYWPFPLHLMFVGVHVVWFPLSALLPLPKMPPEEKKTYR